MDPSSSSSPGPRLSDAERDRVVEVLAASCAEGRLTLDEFSGRVDAAQRAISLGDLDPVLDDLPHPFGSDLAGVMTGKEDPVPAPSGSGRTGLPTATRWTVSIMGGSQRKGRWRVQEKTHALAFMGGCLLDLRDAEVDGATVVINATAVMGGIDIVVPEGIDVQLGGIAVMGSKSARGLNRVAPVPGAPRIVIRAFAFWGGVNVRARPPRAQLHARDDGGAAAGPPSVTGATGGTGGTGGRARGSGPRLIDVVAEGEDGAGPQFGTELGAAGALPDGTVTTMFSDIEGFTAVTEQLGDRRAMELLHEHNDILRRRIGRCGGREVKAQGDGFMIAFASASRALECAVGIQSDLDARNASSPDPAIQVRLGLHAGEAVREGDDFMGGAVILAARITQQAGGGEILASSVVKELCDLTGQFRFTNGRDVSLKGLSEPRRVYSVVGAADPS